MTRELSTDIQPKWKVNDVIRQKVTGHPYLIVHIHKYVATFIVDMEDKASPSSPLVLLPRAYDDYTVDWNMVTKETDEGVEFEFNPLQI